MPDAYLDHAAATPMRPEAVAAVAAVPPDGFGNPSGTHRWARTARRLLEDAREEIADALGAHPTEVVFTSGGTEADDLAVRGVAAARAGVVLCSAAEHHAVLDPTRAVGGSTVAVGRSGRLDLSALAEALDRFAVGPGVALVSVQLANNETGALQPLDEIAAVVAERSPGVPLHTDAVAAAPWLDLSVRARAAQLVSVSGHKVGGPKGVGVLVVRAGTPLEPRLLGGGQELERRAGTPNVAGAVGMAAALAAAVAEREATVERVEGLRRQLVSGIARQVPAAEVVSPEPADQRLPGIVLACFPEVDRQVLLVALDQVGIAASWGASCSSGAIAPSHVLTAMGIPDDLARGALRLSLGWCSTEADVEAVLAELPIAVDRVRERAA